MDLSIMIIAAEYIAITYVFGLLYRIVGARNSEFIQRSFGWYGYCVLGLVGVTFHELSHLIVAVLFRHKINEVRLFRPVQGRADGTLGYVHHAWDNKSWYQMIGNFFIGTAPMFFGAGLLFLLLRIAYPAAFVNVAQIGEIPGALGAAATIMFKPEIFFTKWTPIVILVAMLICPHMHMSWPDIKGATSGAIAMIFIATVMSLVSIILRADIVAAIQSAMNTFVTYYIYALVLGLVMSLIITACFGLVMVIRGRG